ncbi:MAG: hypothetical protein ACQCN6_02900 [Candidatus Bathyarchaeia archaeon]|jgi:hypothetical protein
MNKKQTIFVLLIVLIALSAVAAVLLAMYQAEARRIVFPFQPRQYIFNPADLELYYWARTIFSTVNIVLICVLICSYISIYLKTKSEFTVGLLLFASFLLIKDVTWSPFVIGIAGFNLFGLGPFAFLPDMFEMAALLVLFYLSVKY